jgi:hypothetical protein
MSLRHYRAETAAALAAFLFPLLIYILTLAREITFVDSGELAAVAATLGIAHPPGYPLFTLVGHLFSWIPIGTVAFRIGLLSAAAGALTVVLIYAAGRCLLGIIFPARRRATLTLAPLAGALLFAFAQTPWSQAVVIEVYTLQAMLVMAFIAACAYAWRSRPRAVRHWPLLAFTFGLALTNHLSSILLGPGLILFLAASLIARAKAARTSPAPQELRIPWLRTLAMGLLPLLLYLYLPLRSRMGPLVAWDFPDTFHRFLVHVTARQYHGNLGRTGVNLGELQRFLSEQLPQEASWVFVVLAAVGLFVLLWRSRTIGLVTLLSAAGLLLYNTAYPIHDISLYYVTPLAIVGLWAAVGAGAIVNLAGHLHRAIGIGVALLLCISCLLPLHANWQANDQHDFHLVADYVKDALAGVAPGGVVFSSRWTSFCSPAVYYQSVEGYRSDVAILDLGSLSRPILQRRLAQTAPDLAAACRSETEAVAEIARKAERGEPYDLVAGRVRFSKLKRKLVEHALDLRPTYATPDMTGHPMFARLHFIAEGLLARVRREDQFQPFATPEFRGPRMGPDEIRSEPERAIFDEYSRMLYARARYLRRHGRELEAAALGQRAARLAPARTSRDGPADDKDPR